MSRACNFEIFCTSFLDCQQPRITAITLELCNIWVQLSRKFMNVTKISRHGDQISTDDQSYKAMFICDLALLGFKFMGLRWQIHTQLYIVGIMLLQQEWSWKHGSWTLDIRILRFGSRQVLSFSFALQRQADRGLVDEQEFRDRPRISTQDIEVQKCGPIVSKSDKWQMMLNWNCERLWANGISSCYFSATSNFTFGECLRPAMEDSDWRSFARQDRSQETSSQGIVSGKSYIPTKGSRLWTPEALNPISITQFLASLKGHFIGPRIPSLKLFSMLQDVSITSCLKPFLLDLIALLVPFT